MDFDLNILWIAGWYRRDSDARRQLLDSFALDGEFQQEFGGETNVRQWLSTMEQALNKIAASYPPSKSEAMSIKEIDAIIREWNSNRDFLRDKNGNAPLDHIDTKRDRKLVDRSIVLLLGEAEDNSTVLTDSSAVYPGWMILNLLRYWSVVSREDNPALRNFGPRIPHYKMRKYIEHSS